MSGKYEQILQAAIRSGYLGEECPLAAFVDTSRLEETIASLHRAFPKHFAHTFAAKANTMSHALEFVKEHGMGCEVASPGELEQALRAGFAPGQIVYDEPAKTAGMLARVLELGTGLNIDNFQEFERVQALMVNRDSRSRIGFRINPQVGAGNISAMSTATTTSKFGVALEDEGNRIAILTAYRDNTWLTALHSHVGSQGCSLDLMTAGIRKVVDLAEEINSGVGRQQVEVIDIGGGLPVNFDSEEMRPTFAEFAAKLQDAVPELFSGRYTVKTEFGRSVFAKSGFIASRIEYTKRSGGRRIAISHAGAQIATRTVFMPDHWKLRVSVFDSSGRAKNGAAVEQDIAGPLCFAGDLVATARKLPEIEPGDYVVLHDTGAYYFSNPFYYNALCAPAVYAVTTGRSAHLDFSVWRRKQSVDDMLAVIG
ncbi:MAG: diaminopimelate decarboxylase [Gammaproteobacteria bacterium]|nr:diaminopimelate decarboxylase [Gammaproteobacteria bacterium]